MEYSQTKKAINADSKLKKSLENLVQFSLDKKTLNFKSEELNFDFEYLVSNNIISNDIQLSSDSTHYFSFILFEKIKTLSNFQNTKEFRPIAKLLEELDNYFDTKSFSVFLKIEEDCWTFAIEEHYKINKTDFSDFLNEPGDSLYNFAKGYSNALSNFNINKQDFFNITNRLIELTTSKEVDYNIPLGNILLSVKNKVFSEEQFGLICLNYILENTYNESQSQLLSSIVSGLYSKIGFSFYQDYLKTVIDDNIYMYDILFGLSNINSIDEKECILFISLFEKYKLEDNKILLALSKMMFTILKQDIAKENYYKTCFINIKSLIEVDSPNLIFNIIHDITLLRKNDSECIDLIKHIISQPYFEPNKHLNRILQIFWNLNNTNHLKDVIYSLANAKPFLQLYVFLESSLYIFINTPENRGFDELIIELLIHDEAKYRFIGHDIFNGLSRKNFKFGYNILSLPPISQYKLWVSVCQGLREPKYTIPCLLPLLNSNSDVVRIAFTAKLYEYAENYSGGLIKVLKNNLDLNLAKSQQIIIDIENYIDVFFDEKVLPKNLIKELNPYYTHNDLFEEFNVNYSRHFSAQIQKGSEKNSILSSIATTVHLAKGGGWKIEGKNSITKLNKIGTSMSLPREYFIDPEKFDYQYNVDISKSWRDLFNDIENWLKNE